MVLSDIKKEMTGFSKSQRLIAQFILDHPRNVPFLTAAQVASQVGVSESTVFRFANKLGFTGYPELKVALQESMMNSLTVTVREQAYKEHEETDDVVMKGFALDAQTIMEAASKLNRAALYEVADLIVRSESVYVTAGRSAAALSHYLCFYLSWFLPHVHKLDHDYALERVANLPQDATLIGITFNRCTRSVVDMMALAQSRGIHTVAITNSPTTPVARHAGKLLIVPCAFISFIDSYVAPLSFLNALIVVVSQQKFGEPEVEQRFNNLETLWRERGTYVVDERP